MVYAQIEQDQTEEPQAEEYTVQQHDRANQPKIYYETIGTGPPLILVHGLGGSHRWWRKNLDALAAHFTVYTVDLIGFGKSRDGQRFVLDQA
ncbi:MAG: alpha/beta fold hydrolase, partial [Caldilineaceae bacterium]|nr:alpha/beta fold hydrolase [Caldilineaceae bacterium]